MAVGSYQLLSPAQRESGLPEIGDVIDVRGDDWTLDDQRFGTAECKNNPPANGGAFVCMEFPGLSQEEALSLTANSFSVSKSGDRDIKKYRRYRIAWESLPESFRQEAYYRGMVSLPDWRQGWIIIDKEAAR